ncbi:MAG: hypothetical protein AB2A00_27075 [Myxococcota bacterium]
MPRRTILTEKNRAKRAVNRAEELGHHRGGRHKRKTGGQETHTVRRRGESHQAEAVSPTRKNVRPGRKVSEAAPVRRTKAPAAPRAGRVGGKPPGRRTGGRQLKGSTRRLGRKG